MILKNSPREHSLVANSFESNLARLLREIDAALEI